MKTRTWSLCALLVAALPVSSDAGDREIASIVPDAKRGFEILMTVPMADPVLKTKDLDRLWLVWEDDARERAKVASPHERHDMTFARYGFTKRVSDDSGLPLGYIEDGKGNLVNNCLSCHGGAVAGQTVLGLGNSHFDLTTLVTDVAKLAALDSGLDPNSVNDSRAGFGTPFNMVRGVSNATMFAFILGALRDQHLDLKPKASDPSVFLKHNDLIAPPWWHYKHKTKIYCDAFGSKTHRTLMPFTMSPGNTGEAIRSWEDEFVHIKAFIESLEPPKYPFSIDTKLAQAGREVFNQTCARCHGTYGTDRNYPNMVVPIDEVGTDRVRFDALSPLALMGGNYTWFSNYGKDPIDPRKVGYIAQPLDGIWAKAPYFHNGSVPTLHAVMNTSARPAIWRRIADGYDQEKVGLMYETIEKVPDHVDSNERRSWYDTKTTSHGNEGHTFPDEELNAEEKSAVIEYLKTL